MYASADISKGCRLFHIEWRERRAYDHTLMEDGSGFERDWTEILSPDRVERVGAAGDFRTTDLEDLPPSFILKPSDAEEISRILRKAAQTGRSLHVVSRGHNWGYGDRNPGSAGQILLDLSKMNRILEINAELGYAVVEPGVSQGELSSRLRDEGHPWILDATGSDPESSVTGNWLERGFGHTAYGDHEAHGKVLEAVLPDGRRYQPHLGLFERAKVRGIYENDVGPSTERLFYQGNLGIVTRFCVWLMPRPETLLACFIRIPDEVRAAQAFERLGRLKREGTIASVPHLANTLRVLSSEGLPRTGGELLTEAELKELRMRKRLGAWNLSIDLSGPSRLAKARRAIIGTELGDLNPVFMDARRVSLASSAARLFPLPLGVRRNLAMIRKLMDLYAGAPQEGFMGSAFLGHPEYGRILKDSRPDLTAEGLGLLWISPLFPATSSDFEQVREIIYGGFREFRFEPAATVSLLGTRTACWISNLGFDKGDRDRVLMAKEAFRTIAGRLIGAGYPPYRLGVRESASMPRAPGAAIHRSVLAGIKSSIDPDQLISPDRWGLRDRGNPDDPG